MIRRYNILPGLISLSLHGFLGYLIVLGIPRVYPEGKSIVEVVWMTTQGSEVEKNELPSEPKQLAKMSIDKKKVKAASQTAKVAVQSKVPKLLLNEEVHENSPSPRSHQIGRNVQGIKSYKPQPPYPWICRKRNQEGTVILKVHTKDNGSVEQVVLEKSSGHDRLDEVALETVKSWIFTEADSEKVLSIVFRLKV